MQSELHRWASSFQHCNSLRMDPITSCTKADYYLLELYYWARICKRLWSPGIDSEESISPTCVAWQAGTRKRVVVPARQAGNRFLVSLKGLQIRALYIVQYSTLLFVRNISIEFSHFSLKKLPPLHHVKLQSYRFFETNYFHDSCMKIYDLYTTSYWKYESNNIIIYLRMPSWASSKYIHRFHPSYAYIHPDITRRN